MLRPSITGPSLPVISDFHLTETCDADIVSMSCCLMIRLWVRDTLQWRHNECDGVSHHRHLHCLLKCFFQTQIKENVKAPSHWPVRGESTGDRWIPLTKGQWRGKCFHLMTSSWGVCSRVSTMGLPNVFDITYRHTCCLFGDHWEDK